MKKITLLFIYSFIFFALTNCSSVGVGGTIEAGSSGQVRGGVGIQVDIGKN